jgi:hypothetical protein
MFKAFKQNRIAKKNNATADSIRAARQYRGAPSSSDGRITSAGMARASADYMKSDFLRRTKKK